MTWWERLATLLERTRHRRRLFGAALLGLALAVPSCAPVGGRHDDDTDEASDTASDETGGSGRSDARGLSSNVTAAASRFVRDVGTKYAENADEFARRIESGEWSDWESVIDEWSKANARDREDAWRENMRQPLFDAMGGTSGAIDETTRRNTAAAARAAAKGFRAALKGGGK